MTKTEPYPFAEKEEQYRNFSVSQLLWSVRDARKAADALRGEPAEAWYLDDMHTLLKVLNEQRHV